MAQVARARPAARPRPATRPPLRPAPRARPARRPARGRAHVPVTGGVAWICVVGVLLAGIVALNVAVLRLNVASERLDARRDHLRAENEALASRLSSLTAVGRIEAVARRKLGLVAPSQTTYVRVRAK